MTTIIEHLEAFCGPIEGGHRENLRGERLPFQVVVIEGGPHPGVKTFSTIGLSNFPLKLSEEGVTGRQELVMFASLDAIASNTVELLQQVGLEAISSGRACLRGGVIGPRGRLFKDFDLTSLYITMPVYFPDEFARVQAEHVGEVLFMWLVPISSQEADYVQTHGWNAFEDRLELVDPDLLDLSRASVVPDGCV